MKRRTTRRTSIVPLVVLQAACAGVASVTPACGETESNGPGNATNTSSRTLGVGGTVFVLAVTGFGGTPFTGVTSTTSTTSSTTTNTTSSNTTSSVVGAGGSLIVLAVAGFGGIGAGGDAGGALGEGGDAGAPGASGQGSG